MYSQGFLASLALKNTPVFSSGIRDEKFEAFHAESSCLTENESTTSISPLQNTTEAVVAY